MRNLSWHKNNNKIVDGISYKIHHGKKEFVLTIHKLSLEDAGNYVCSGFDVIMGNHFNSSISVDVTESRIPCKFLLYVLY